MPNNISHRSLGGGLAEILLYGSIGNTRDGYDGITAKAFDEALKAISPATTLRLRISSPGGDTTEAMAIIAQLGHWRLNVGGRIVVHVDGIAASCGSWIAMVGDEILAAPDSLLMIHSAKGSAEALDHINSSMAGDYAAKSGAGRAQVDAWMADEHWFTAEEAVKVGFVDRIEGEALKLAAFDGLDGFGYRHIPTTIGQMATEYWAKRNPPTPPAASAQEIWGKWNSPVALRRGAK
jgi:ATP-dependent Clp protease protease subunit